MQRINMASDQKSSSMTHIALGVLPIIVGVIAYLSNPIVGLSLSAVETWVTCMLLFVMADLMGDSLKYRQWNGYRNLSAVVALLTLGVAPAFGVVIFGSLLAALLRTLKVRCSNRTLSLAQTVELALNRIALTGIPLTAAASIYVLLNGAVPLPYLNAETLPPLAAMLLTCFVISRPLESQLIPETASLTRFQLLADLQILFLMVTLPLVLVKAGFGVFIVIMGLVATLLLRHWQVEETQHTLSRRVQELSMLNNIGQMISANLVLDDVLLNIYRQVIQFIDLSVFYIALYDKEQNTLDYRLVMANGQRVKWAARKLGGGTVEQIIKDKKPLRITSSQRNAASKEFTPSGGYLTFVGVPLLAGTEVLGVMAVMSSESENDFTQDEVTILQTIASQAGLAVRNAVLFTQRTQLAENLARINHTVQNSFFNADRDEALRLACHTALTIADAQKAAVLLLDKDKGTLKLTAHINLSPALEETLTHEKPYNPDTYADGIHVATNPTGSDSLLDYRSAAEIPLQSSASTLGILVIYHDTPYYYRQTVLDLLNTLANQIGAALDNAYLFQALELYAFEMTQLVHFSRISTASLEFDKIVKDIAEVFRQMMNANRVILVLSDGDRVVELATVVNGDFQVAQLDGVPMRAFPELLHPSEKVYHITSSTISDTLRRLMHGNEEETMAFVPLMLDDAMFGAVLLGNRQMRTFTPREWQFMEMAANQITAQIKNVQLYQNTQRKLNQRLEQLSLIEEIAQQITSSLDLNQTIDNVLEAAMRTTQADLVSLSLLTDSDQFWIIEQRRENGKLVKHYASQNKNSGVLGEVVRTGKPVIVPENSDYPGYVRAPSDTYRSSMAVPMFHYGKVVGALNLESLQPYFFERQQVGFINNLASHAVLSIENARQLAERQHEIQMLRSLRELSLVLAASDDIHSVAQAILEQGLDLLLGQDAVIYRYDDEADQLTLLAQIWSYENGSGYAERVLPYELAHNVAQSGEMRLIDDVCNSELFRQSEAFHYVSVIGVPIKRGLHVHSVLVMTFASQREFRERDVNTLDLLVSQALGHLENATLHERIRAGRDQMRVILDSTRDGMILLDRDVRLVEINPAAERLLGINLEEHIGEYFPDTLLRHAEDAGETGYSPEEVQHMARILRLEPESTTRRQFQHTARNQIRFIEEIGSPVRDEHQNIVGRLLVLRDITEERLLSEQREDLTRMMIHDLRAPLGVMIRSHELALPSIAHPAEHDEVRKLMKSSLSSANRLLRLVNSLLDIAKMEESGMKLSLSPAPIEGMIETAITELLPSMQEAELKLNLSIPLDVPMVQVDRDKVERVLINLLDNAMRYTPKGGEILVAVRVLAETHFIEVQIADSGPGIPVHEREQVFAKFHRIKNNDPLRGSKGSGLGLTFCKLTVEAHGGRIKVDAQTPLPGASFSFTLPTT
jgi:PAS domain S-box-containing protein